MGDSGAYSAGINAATEKELAEIAKKVCCLTLSLRSTRANHAIGPCASQVSQNQNAVIDVLLKSVSNVNA